MSTQRDSRLVDVYVRSSLAIAKAPADECPDSARLARCLELHGIRRERSYLAPDGQRMLCHFRAPDAESLRMALRVAGIAYDALWIGSSKNIPGAAEFGLSEDPAFESRRRQ